MVYFGGFFPQTGIFAGFSLHIINLAVRISAAMHDGRGQYIFRVPNSLQGCDGWGEGRGILYQSLFGPVERYTPLAAEFGPEKKENHFVSGNFAGFSVYFVGRISEAAMSGPRSSFRGRRSLVGGVQRSSVGCSVAQKGAA